MRLNRSQRDSQLSPSVGRNVQIPVIEPDGHHHCTNSKHQGRVLLLTNTYAPYRSPVWDALARQVAQLDVVLICEQENNRTWAQVIGEDNYSLHVLRTRGVFLPMLDSGVYWGGQIGRVLDEINPTHLIVTGYSALQFVMAIHWAVKRGVPIVQWYESHALSSRFRKGPVSWFREIMLRKADAWAVPGIMAREYLITMGIPPERIAVAPNTVDVMLYSNSTDDAHKLIDGPAQFLYVGQFIGRKNPRLLIDAFASISADMAILRLIGYGPQERMLRRHAKGATNIEFLDATTNPKETAQYYACADVVVMPSTREVWGLVINEALAAGCYVLSSSVAGVTPDLVKATPIDVGRPIDPFANVSVLVREIMDCVSRIHDIRRRRPMIQQWGLKFRPELTADGLVTALALALSLPTQKLGK